MNEHDQQILEAVRNKPGQPAKEIAARLGLDKRTVNAALYRLDNETKQDKNTGQWYPIADDDDDDDDDDKKSGVEIEKDDQEGSIEIPFDPEKIKIQTKNIGIQQLMNRIKYGEIDLSPDFQRLRGIWDAERKSRLIESLLLRIPIPVFYVAADHSDHWAVVDGVQRISTIHGYVVDDSTEKLHGLEYLIQFNGKTYNQLPRPMQRRISETELVINVISSETPEDVKFNVFSRINTGGLKLNSQEIIHAMSKDPARSYLKALADSEEFKKATDNSISIKRMADRECVLRFLTFYIKPWEEYKASGSKENFSKAIMKKVYQMNDNQRDEITRDFKKSMQASFDLFGPKAFRKHTTSSTRSPINKALFEIWSVPLARYSEDQIKTLISNKDVIYKQFIELCKNEDFYNSITLSTGTTQRVRKRFSAINELLAGFI